MCQKIDTLPKNDEESRVIMMFGIHSKLLFSIFASTMIKKTFKSVILSKHQYGTKKAGAETMIHQHPTTSSFDDVQSSALAKRLTSQ